LGMRCSEACKRKNELSWRHWPAKARTEVEVVRILVLDRVLVLSLPAGVALLCATRGRGHGLPTASANRLGRIQARCLQSEAKNLTRPSKQTNQRLKPDCPADLSLAWLWMRRFESVLARLRLRAAVQVERRLLLASITADGKCVLCRGHWQIDATEPLPESCTKSFPHRKRGERVKALRVSIQSEMYYPIRGG
jgi:hypothetical protein